MDLDIRVDGRFATDEEKIKILCVLQERNIEIGGRPIRHYTINFAEEREAGRSRKYETPSL